jgi:hypothetical protein
MSVLDLALKLARDCPNGTVPRDCPMGQPKNSVPNVPLSRTVPLGQLGQKPDEPQATLLKNKDRDN